MNLKSRSKKWLLMKHSELIATITEPFFLNFTYHRKRTILMGIKTKIDWCDSSWNPVTGCLHGCQYCYARGIMERFGGACHVAPHYHDVEDPVENVGVVYEYSSGKNHVLNEPYFDAKNEKVAPYPYFFDPTLHRYKLDEPQRWKKPRTIFVCSMADLFGEWVPTEWISAVIEACKAAPQHRYLFLTKNPKRYIKLIQAGILPLNNDRFWYGTTCENPMQEYFFCGKAKTFVSIEPIFAPFTGLNYFDTPPEQRVDWIIVGAETGNRKGKVIPEKSWIDELAYCSAQQKTPIFMKSSLRGIMGVDFVQQFPWDK